MKMKKILLLIIAVLACGQLHAASTIDPTQPRQSTPSNPSPLSSSVVRNNFLAAYNDVNNILGKFASTTAPSAPIPMQDWVDTTGSPIYKFMFWNQTTTTWVQWGTLNINTGIFSTVATSSSFAATQPITVGFSGGVATFGINLDSNFAVSGGNLALASVANGHLIANCSGGAAESGNCAWSTFADQAIGSSNGMLPYRIGGSWSNISTGVSGATIPLNNTANVFSATQSIITNTSALPATDTGTMLTLGNVDGTPTRLEMTSGGSTAFFTGRTSLGTIAVPLTLTIGSHIVSFNAHGYDGTSWGTTPNGSFRIFADGTWTSSSHPTRTCEATTAASSLTMIDQWCVYATGGATLGSPTGGDQGAGKINAIGLYVNGSAVLAAGITALSGDGTATGPGSAALTLATVNTNVGSFGSATQTPQITVNGKGLITAAANVTVTPAIGSITGLGTGVGAALAVALNTSGGLASSNNAALSGTITGNFTMSGNVTHSGQLIATGTSAPSSAAGNTVVMGTISAPSLANNGQAFLYNTAVNGAVVQGQGSTFATALANNGGAIALGVSVSTVDMIAFGKLAAASLSTSGTIGGSLCRTSGGDFIYASGVNCFTSGAATSLAPGTTTISPSNPGYALTNAAGVVSNNQLYSTAGGFINKFRNATFDVGQRGNSITVSVTGSYALDGWKVLFTGSANVQASQQPGNMANNGGTFNDLLLSGAASNTGIKVAQRIESFVAAPFSIGQSVTISFKYLQTTGSPVTPKVSTCFASATDNFTTCTADLASTSITSCADSTWCTEAYTFTPSANAVNGYEVTLDCGAAILAGKLCVFGAPDIRLTPGVTTGVNSNPPLPELRPVQTELAFCQRYYFRRNSTSTTDHLSVIQGVSASAAFGHVLDLPVQMRTAGTVGISSFTHLSAYTAAGSATAITAAGSNLTSDGYSVYSTALTAGPAWAAGQASALIFNTASGWIDVSSEL
jgi:hypothetical protein